MSMTPLAIHMGITQVEIDDLRSRGWTDEAIEVIARHVYDDHRKKWLAGLWDEEPKRSLVGLAAIDR